MVNLNLILNTTRLDCNGFRYHFELVFESLVNWLSLNWLEFNRFMNNAEKGITDKNRNLALNAPSFK